MSRPRPAASSRAEAPPSLHWQIAWRHLRAGDRPPSRAWPAVGLALYLLVVGGGFVLYALYGFSPVESGLPERVALDSSLVGLGFDPTADLPPPAQAYFGVLGAITLLLGAGLLLGAVLSLVFTLLATVITVSVMLGCMALVVVLSLMTGLELELRDKILGQRAHIRVASADGRPFADYRDLAKAIADKPGILGASPYLQGEVMVRSGFQRQGGIPSSASTPSCTAACRTCPTSCARATTSSCRTRRRSRSRSSASRSRPSSRRRRRPTRTPRRKGRAPRPCLM